MLMIVLYIFIGIIALIAAAFLFLWICSLFIDPKKEYEKNSAFYRTLLDLCTAFSIRLLRIKVHVEGKEKVPEGKKLFFTGNHRSNFDPIITWYVFRKWKIAYISKEGNFKIPIFGRFIRKCCFMKIDRDDPRQSLKVIFKAAELLEKQEVSIGSYPEGTRNKAAEGLLPFHNGVFKSAQRAKADIVVIALSGTEKIAKNYPFRRSDVYLKVADVIDGCEAQSLTSAQIGERVRDKLEEALYM